MRIAFQGERGAYSEQAALNYFSEKAITLPCKTLRKTFASVEDRSADFGIVPAENSLEGSVNETYDLLLESPLRIVGEYKLRVEHHLMALPSTTIEKLSVIHSHPQALAQCSAFLETLEAKIEPTYDTAGSAKMIAEKGLHNAGAIASDRAAQIYGLKILRSDIANNNDNYTRFFAIGNNHNHSTDFDKTSIVFITNHTPGSLYRALGELAQREINLTKIESRPIRATPWEYSFFVDFEGHRDDHDCAAAIEALQKSSTFLKVLGSYPRATND
jgi:chorismate mutase/prephenate dehydratase